MLSLIGFAPVWFIHFRVQVVMLVMLVKPADISPHGYDCFQILDSAAAKYQVKLKEFMFIKWEKPDLNQQVKHINLTLSL